MAVLLASLVGFGVAKDSHAQGVARVLAEGSSAKELPDELPEEPGQAALGTVSGTVLDVNGGVVPGAQVTLFEKDRAGSLDAVSDASGQFSFSGLSAGRFRVRVAAAGLKMFLSPEFDLKPGEALTIPEFHMPLAQASSDVSVTATQEQIATEQVKAEEKQRAFGVLPNFYSSYIWNAAPMDAKQKFSLALHSIGDPFSFVGAGIAAGIEQAKNIYPGYNQGAAGYGRRFGAAYGDDGISRLLGSAVLPSILHQDPRYFYQGSGTKKSRLRHAIASAVICRGDNGQAEVNYSYIGGSFASGAISNLYYPDGSRGAGLVIANGFLNIAGHAADDVVREFVLKRVTPKVPDYANGRQ